MTERGTMQSADCESNEQRTAGTSGRLQTVTVTKSEQKHQTECRQ